MDDEHALRLKLSIGGASAVAGRAQALLAGGTRAKRVAPPSLAQCDAVVAEADAWPVRRALTSYATSPPLLLYIPLPPTLLPLASYSTSP